MRDKLGPGTTLSYCTNVLPSDDLESLAETILEQVPLVAQRLNTNDKVGLGLCVPPLRPIGCLGLMMCFVPGLRDRVGREYLAFIEALDEAGAELLTINAFPATPFHNSHVKHLVYEPDWAHEDREAHTYYAAGMAELTENLRSLSISTLPIGWPNGQADATRIRTAAQKLREFADTVQAIDADAQPDEEQASPIITLDLEPEPGCILDTCDDVIAFFDEHLPDETHRERIGVCHDVCHAAVMFEDQRTVLRRYAEAGIRVNKVQISSALDVDVQKIGPDAAIEHLRPFAEPRYLHQTGFVTGEDRDTGFELIEDLPEAIERLEGGETPDRLRVHFHVPVYLDSIGPLGTTNDQIAEAVAAARKYHDTRHFEVETYAWGVLPDELKRDTLAEGIADELKWVLDNCGTVASP